MGAVDTLRSALRGAFADDDDVVRPHRLSHPTGAPLGLPLIESVERETSGARLEFATAARWIELDLRFIRTHYAFMPFAPPPAVVAVTVDDRVLVSSFDEGDVVTVQESLAASVDRGASSTMRVELGGDGSVRPVEVWLPHTSGVELLDVRADADLLPQERRRRRWVHYGSSISQCAEADTPLGVWPVITARALDFDLFNLGLAGNAILDGFAARTIRDLPADLISLKIGINVVNTDALRLRAFIPAVHGFLDTVRDGHPHTPILVISPIFCPAHEDAPGPTEWTPAGRSLPSSVERRPYDGRLTLREIREVLARIVAERSAADPALQYLDGLELFGPEDADHLPDGLHPDPAGYALMGARMARELERHRAR